MGKMNICIKVVFFFCCISFSNAHALSVRAFSNVHTPSIVPGGLTAALTSTSVVSGGRGLRLIIDADHLEIICNSGRVDDKDTIVRVKNNVNTLSLSDGLHINSNVFVQYRIYAEHIFLVCGDDSGFIRVFERTSNAKAGSC